MRAVMILGLALGGSSALAQGPSGYTGVAVGVFDHGNETAGAFSDSVSFWKLYGGFQPNQYFGLEFARESTSSLDVDDPGSPLTIATRRLTFAHSVDFRLTTFKAMGRLPLRQLDLWIGYGSYYMDASVDFTFELNSSTRRASLSVEDSGELMAVGVDWKLGEAEHTFDVRLEYEWLDFPFSDASTIALGAAYRFGGS
jgi:hypothetical protein